MAETMPESEFRELERQAARAADALLDGFIIELSRLDTTTLRSIADYRDAINPDCWMARCIREYVEVWR